MKYPFPEYNKESKFLSLTMACIYKANPYLLKYFLKKILFIVFAFKGSPCYQPCTNPLSLNLFVSNSLEIEHSSFPYHSIWKEPNLNL